MMLALSALQSNNFCVSTRRSECAKQSLLARRDNGWERLPPRPGCHQFLNANQAGWEIPAVLEQALNSDLPGELKALVTSNVYDTATGRFVLIPQGSRSIGAPWSTAPRQGERIMSVTNCGQNSRMNALWSVGSEYLEFAFEETLRNLFRFFTEPCRIFRGAVKYGCGLEGLESSVGSD